MIWWMIPSGLKIHRVWREMGVKEQKEVSDG